MKNALYLSLLSLCACSPGFTPYHGNLPESVTTTYFPVASATMSVTTSSHDESKALTPQGSATINVSYNNPGASTFSLNTASFGNAITVSGTDLNLGTIALSGLDDNSLRVCTGVGAPANKCNRLYIRMFTLGTASGGITGIAGFINKDALYGIDVLAGSVLTPLGFNASAVAPTVTNAADVYVYTIPGNMNRVRLSNLSVSPIPVKADLSNAGSGNYEMNLVVQYALGYTP